MKTYTRFLEGMRSLLHPNTSFCNGPMVRSGRLPACYRTAFQDIIDLVEQGLTDSARSIMSFLSTQRNMEGDLMLPCVLPLLVSDSELGDRSEWRRPVRYPVTVELVLPADVVASMTSQDMVSCGAPYFEEGGSRIVRIDCPDGDELLRRLPELGPHVMAGWNLFMVTHI